MPTDFWGLFWATILPNWIAAAGGLAATLLAIYSLVVSNRAKSTATEAVAADKATRRHTADAIEEIARPLLPSENLTPSETLVPSGDDGTVEEEANVLNQERLEAMLWWLRNDHSAPPRT